MSETLLLLALLGLIGLLGLGLVDLLIRNAVVGAGLVLAVTVLSAAISRLPEASLGGAKISLTDIVSVVILAAAIARHLRRPRLSRLEYLVILLGVLALFSLFSGVLTFGLEPAVNEFRSYLRFLGFASYFASFGDDPELRERIGRVMLWGGAGMALLVAVRWAALLGGVNLGVLSATYDAPIRVVSGTETFFLAQVFLATLPVWSRGFESTRLRQLSALLAIIVIVLNRRTVWLALLVAFCVVIIRNRQLGKRLAAVLVGGAVVLALVLQFLPNEGDQVAQSATNIGTLTWRIQGWSELFAQDRILSEWILGEPFGTGFEREVAVGRTVESNPHSFYVETLLRLGALGLLALLWVAIASWRGLLRSPPQRQGLLTRQALLVMLTTQMVWWLTWAPGLEQGMITGLAVGAAASGATRRLSTAPGKAEDGAVLRIPVAGSAR